MFWLITSRTRPSSFGLPGGIPGPYGGGHARYPPHRDLQSKRIIRPNYSPFAKELPNNSAYFSLGHLRYAKSKDDGIC